MKGYDEIYWHDCQIESAIELTESDKYILNVHYPVNWEEHIFEPRAIVFEDFCEGEIKEIPFAGKPTILEASVVTTDGKYSTLRLETNAGYRLLKATSVVVEKNQYKHV